MRMIIASVLCAAGLFSFVSPKQADAQTWNFTEKQDAITDRTSWSLIAIPEAPAPRGARFEIECFGADTSTGEPSMDTIIDWGVPIYPLYPDGDGVHAMSITARFGDSDPVTLGFSTSQTYTRAWQPSAGKKLLGGFGEVFMAPLRGKAVNFNWTPVQLFISATAASPLIFRATAVDGTPVTLVFRDDGLMAALRQMPESCLPDGYKEAMAGNNGSTRSKAEAKPRVGSIASLDLFDAEGWTELENFAVSALPQEAVSGRVESDRTLVEARKFAFMQDGSQILRVMDPAWGKVQLFFLIDENDKIWWLNGTSPPIYSYLAAHTPVIDTETKARQMLYFYMFFIQAEEGPFAVVESVDDFLFPSSMKSASPEITANIKAHLKPSKCTGGSPTWTCTCSVFYSNAVFDAVIEFEAGGQPRMVSDVPVFANLPVKIAMPIR